MNKKEKRYGSVSYTHLDVYKRQMLTYAGTEGLKWEEKDGRPCLTEYGKSALQGGSVQNVPVPEEWGGGNYGDGSNKLCLLYTSRCV